MSDATVISRLRRATARLPPIGLEELQATAELQTRIDRKYLVPLPAFEAMVGEFARDLRIIQIESLRDFRYRSIYFDTERLDFFRHHVQGRRHRYKARTRVYRDSGLCMVEVKLKGARGQTIKKRQPYSVADAGQLNAGAEQFVLENIAHTQQPGSLLPVLTCDYRRLTLAHEASASRITCDVELRFNGNDRERSGLHDAVLIESKTLGAAGGIERWLVGHGVRPYSVSKYCLGIALLYPQAVSNPWRRTLLRHFGPPASALPAE